MSNYPVTHRETARTNAVAESGPVVSVGDLGTLIRLARQAAGITQKALADQVGSSRQWVIRLEQGEPTVAMGRVLDALSSLGLEMVAQHGLPPVAPRRPRTPAERRIAELTQDP